VPRALRPGGRGGRRGERGKKLGTNWRLRFAYRLALQIGGIEDVEAWLASKPPGFLDRWIAYFAAEASDRPDDPDAGGKPTQWVSPEQSLLQMRMAWGGR